MQVRAMQHDCISQRCVTEWTSRSSLCLGHRSVRSVGCLHTSTFRRAGSVNQSPNRILDLRFVRLVILHLREHELLLILDQELRASLHIHKQGVDLADVLDVHFLSLALEGHEVGDGDQVNGVPEGALDADLCEQLLGLLRHLHVFFLCPDVDDLPNLALGVRLCGDDEHAIQQIERDTVGALVVCAADVRDSTVCGHDDNWRGVGLQCPVQEGEALDVQHVHLVNEEHARYDVGLALLPPLCHLGIDLLTYL
mmetsp:Transcript_76154/g.123054  ORF Transcript_76154/g.123054 Transcript_76154/m.123054 type:complete len:253 (+) Transcript_76154:116-874(+)